MYPVGASGGLKFIYPVKRSQIWYPSKWSGNKVLWASRTYRGRILVRGRRLDQRYLVRFGRGRRPGKELRLPAIEDAQPETESGWYERGTYTRIRAPGCYGWQVDGEGFSYVIVFRAVVVR